MPAGTQVMSATESEEGLTAHEAARKRKRPPRKTSASNESEAETARAGPKKLVGVGTEGGSVETESVGLASETVGIAPAEPRLKLEGEGIGGCGRENASDAGEGGSACSGRGMKGEIAEESDSEEKRVAAPASLESFRFEGTAKRKTGAPGDGTPQEGATRARKDGAEGRPDRSVKNEEEASADVSDEPTTSGSRNPDVEVAVGWKKTNPEDETRLFRQYLKQRLPPPVRPFGNESGNFFVGTSGWDYKHWKGPVYPEKLSKQDWFTHYCSLFNTVEINNTFYRLPAPPVFESWARQAPEGFVYALKFSRFGSHMKKLSDPQGTVGLFVERAAHLGGSLQGPVLVQLPPRFRANAARLDEFLWEVPRGARWTVEMRDPSWLCEDIYTVLRRHNAALCIHDHEDIGKGPHPKVLTADWTYVRYHGPNGNYHGGYDKEYLAQQAGWIRGLLAESKDVYAYFNNDMQGHAFFDAQELRALVEKGPVRESS